MGCTPQAFYSWDRKLTELHIQQLQPSLTGIYDREIHHYLLTSMENRVLTWYPCLLGLGKKNKEDFAGLLPDLSFCCVIHWFQRKQKAGRGQLCWNPSSSTAFLLGALNLLFFHIKTKPELQTIRPLSHQATINKTCICTVFSYSLLCEPLNETEIGITWGEAERENLMGTA